MARWFVDRLPQKGIPSVSLRRLLPEARFVGCPDWEVSGCTSDSRRIDPGQVFVAVRGARHDGHAFVAQALERGAAGVIVERVCPEAGALQAIVPNSRIALAKVCQALAGDPSHQLSLLGVTGTCGKSVTSLLLRSILESNGERMGLVSAQGWSDGVDTHPLGQPVPRTESLAVMLAAMVDRGCSTGVIEVAPEALELKRLEGLKFDAAVVSDLGGPIGWNTHDLVDRRRRKAKLVQKIVPGGVAIVNADDPHAELLGGINLDARRVTFALDREADVTGRIERVHSDGTRFVLRGFGHDAVVELPLVGRASVSQALAAAAVAWSKGVMVDSVVAGLEAATTVSRRMEAIREGQDFEVRLDEACSGPPLQHALEAFRELTSGTLHCVIGAEGNQPRFVRHALAEAAEQGADRIILTTNNPRTEDPNQIFDDLLAGFRQPGRVRIETDRHRAIETALRDACPGDGVLIAGKGASSYQIFADRALRFSDHEVAVNWLRTHKPKSRRTSA